MLDEFASELWARSTVQVIVLLVGCVAVACALKLSSRTERTPTRWAIGLATIGLVAPLLALALTMFDLADTYRRVLEIEGFRPSTAPLPPRDQKSTALGQVVTFAPLVIGQLVGVILPVATWVWVSVLRPRPEQRTLRVLAVAAAGVLTVALWAASRWAGEYIFYQGFINVTCKWYLWQGAYIDEWFEALERLRALILLAGAGLGVAAVRFAVVQTRRGFRLGPREWATLLGLLAVAVAAKLWTADERRDTRAYIRWEGAGHGRFGRDPDLIVGPTLDRCSYDWPGSDVVFVDADPDQDRVDQLLSDITSRDICGDPEGILVLVAEPTLEISRIGLVLQTAQAEGSLQLGVASLRPSTVTRATTGEFVRHRSCVVEFSLGPEGVPLDRFSTWAELAAAADAAGGSLVINPAI